MIWVKYIKKRHFGVHFKNELVRSAFFVFLPCAHFGEKGRENFGAFLFEDAARHFHFMIEQVGIGELVGKASSLLLVGAEIDARNAGVEDGTHTHGAWLQRDIEFCLGKPPGMFFFARLIDGAHLGMSRRHLQPRPKIISPSDDLPA